MPESDRRKIALFTNVDFEAVISALDKDSIYKIPAALHREGVDIDPDRQAWQPATVRESVLEQPPDRGPQVRTLAMVDRLLGEPERARVPPPDLDDHDHPRRPRIDGEDVCSLGAEEQRSVAAWKFDQ